MAPNNVVLEPYLQNFLNSLPDMDITQIPPEIIRANEANVPINPPEVLEEHKSISSRDGSKKISLTITRPIGSEKKVLPVILYLHGGGWVVGSELTHKVTRSEFTVRANAVVVFVNYSLSPEVRHPVAVEECYDALEWTAKNGASINADPSKLVVAGDSAGGNLSTVLAILDKQRGLNAVKYQVLLYPVTDDDLTTGSYEQFQEGYYLTRAMMKWFWDHYCDEEDRHVITACPLHATIEELKGLPPAFIATAEADVLRDEGEAYARKLIAAGVQVTAVRVLGLIHGVYNIGNLSPLASELLDQIVDTLHKFWGTSRANL
ncbi:Alpha/Beta hydrolase protein [Phascolomyces articulosus]|uniref:Alpha/Beta hydrolase protein n=1 Tax=Phascolomyces articulosus TaxID=60185 RepID=A0AAD5K850_9FUNG|nr:Alpha/Beta hydrolase protein [Phascolomyces articulosus]